MITLRIGIYFDHFDEELADDIQTWEAVPK
jgi:hypothetical protein